MVHLLVISCLFIRQDNHFHPNFNFPPDYLVTHSSKHSSTEETIIQYINIIIPYVEVAREYEGDINKAALVQVMTTINSNNINISLLATDMIDIAANKLAKEFLSGMII